MTATPTELADDVVHGILRRVAGHGLIPEAPTPITLEPLGELRFRVLLRRASQERLIGLLLAVVEAGRLAVTDEQALQILDEHTLWCTAVLRLERAMLEAVDHLEVAGVPTLVLKGSAHARLLYQDPSWRMFGDTDLLVPGSHIYRAIDALGELGYRREVPELRPGFDERFAKGVTLCREGGEEIDLHRTLLFGTFGFLIDTDVLWNSARPFTVADRQLLALGPEEMFLHSCYHAALGDPRPLLSSIREVAVTLRMAEDQERLLRLIDAWQAGSVVQRAVGLCEQVLKLELRGQAVNAAHRHSISRRELRAIRSYTGMRRGFRSQVLASLNFQEGLRERLTLLGQASWPVPSHRIATGHRLVGAWWVRGVRSGR